MSNSYEGVHQDKKKGIGVHEKKKKVENHCCRVSITIGLSRSLLKVLYHGLFDR